MSDILGGIISFIGIGSNIGDSLTSCRGAIESIAALKDCELSRRSSFYRTEPVGYSEQDWFVNAVLEVKTLLPPRRLLMELQGIERGMGRLRKIKWGPRVIDLDILLYGQDVVMEDDLLIPHPELHKRRFVMMPLSEIAPYVIHPAFGVSIAGLMKRIKDNSRVEIIEGI